MERSTNLSSGEANRYKTELVPCGEIHRSNGRRRCHLDNGIDLLNAQVRLWVYGYEPKQ